MATTRLPAPLYRELIRAALCLLAAGASAQGVPDPAQFELAAPEPAAPRMLGLRASLGFDVVERRRALAGPGATLLRGVADFRKEWSLGVNGRFVLSDRVEGFADAHGATQARNALREAYATMQFGAGVFVDVGRLNLRGGVGAGFNPTDWLREGAALPQNSQNPASLRDNRLGTFMLRVQAIEDWGAAHVAVIPHLAGRQAEASAYGFAWGRTNADRALHVRVAPRLSDTVSVDLLAYARQGRHPQWGMNLTSVVSNALIVHAELAAGRRVGLGPPGQAAPRRSHQRLAAGASWTTLQGATLTLERHLATDALGAADWDAWRMADEALARGLGQLRAQRSEAQEPLVRDTWFARAAIAGVGPGADVDLGAFARVNAHDHSTLWQLDAAWHLNRRTSLHASAGGFAGRARTELGANPTRSLFTVRVETVY